MLKHLSVAAAMLLLVGCATQPGQCDSSNSDASLIAKINCDHAGGYRAQISQREQELADARAENALFHQVYEEIAAQQLSTRQSLTEQQQQQATLQKSMDQLLAQLKKRHANKADVQQQIAGLQQSLAAPAASANAADVEARRAELKALQQKVSRLQLSLGYE